jgi:hypothetical protein
MVSNEFVHVGMPLVEYGSAVWVIANQDGALSYKFGDVPIRDGVYGLQNLISPHNSNDEYQDAYTNSSDKQEWYGIALYQSL